MKRRTGWRSAILTAPVAMAFAIAVATAATVIGFGALTASGQSGPGVPLAETVEAINQSRVATRVLYVTAHPDDEDAGLLAYLARGLGADVAILTITRGQGGQNAAGPEQDGPLGVIRTAELLRAGSHYGVHQYFTRAVDTGFSKSPQRTMKIWGDQLPMEDMVRVIRTYRPQVVINGWGGVKNGHGQHQASGILTPQAVAAAADPSKFPEQIAEGLPAWKVGLELRPASFGGAGGGAPGAAPAGNGAAGGRGAVAAPPIPSVLIPTSDISPLWGVSYIEMGAEGHGEHRSQGTPTLFGGGFGRRQSNLIIENPNGTGGGLFDPKLLGESITTLAARFPSLQAAMAPALAAADQNLSAAAKSALALDRTAAAHSIAEAGKQIATMRDAISKQNGADKAAVYEVERLVERIDRALEDTVSLSIAVNADRHELVAGENFSVTASFPDKPAVAVQYAGSAAAEAGAPAAGNASIGVDVPAGWTLAPGDTKQANGSYRFTIAIPERAVAPSSPGDVVVPWPQSLATLSVPVSLDGYSFTARRRVEFSETKTTGIETYPLELVPAVTLTVEPQQDMVPVKHAAAPVKLLARVRYHGTKSANVSVGLDAPVGWNMQPVAPLDFSASGDQLVQFVVTPPAGVKIGAYPLHPYAKVGDEVFRTSLEPIPTMPSRDWSEPDDASVHVLDLNVPAGLHVGYIDANDDLVPETLRRIGIQVDLLDEVALAFGDLSRYDAIVVGLRAYELRPDVLHSNPRLLEYAKSGGTLLVQYERDFAWNKMKPGPYDASMANGGTRVTDAESPVRFLAPKDPFLNSPNRISMADFQGWVQERGIYFWEKWDPRYQPVIGLTEAGEAETAASIMYAKYGKGLYIYTGLDFFRELPAGVPGAYRLFVNLLSQTRHGTLGSVAGAAK